MSVLTLNKNKSQMFFGASIAFSIITPALFLILMYFQSIALNTDMYSIIFNNVGNTLMFTISMIQPFCALIIKNSVNDIKENKNINISQIMIYLILISQLIVGNIVSCICLVMGLFNIKNKGENIINKSMEEIKNKSVNINLIGCIFIILVSIFCAYVKLKTI